MEELILTCIQCEKDFEFSIAEQEYYGDRGFDPPKRCPSCRKNKSKAAGHHSKKNRYDNKQYKRIKFDD